MAGYLDKLREMEQSKHGFDTDLTDPGSGGQSPSNDAPKGFQLSLDREKSELSEKRSALLYQLRKGQSWLLDQHSRWQSADTTSADDAEFSRVWNGWWELDHQLRTDHGFQGCIYGPDGACPDGFPCQGCTDILTSNIVVQLELT